jgi:DNA-binding CsgD family transcriptional regulator
MSDGLRSPIGAALETCFEAVLTPDLWPVVTEELTRSLGALGSCFHMNGVSGERRFLAPMSRRYRDMLGEFQAGGWAEHDLRGQRGWPMLQRGAPLILEQHVTSPAQRGRLPIYRELFQRHDLEMFAGVGFRSGGQQWTFNLVRSERMGGYEGDAAAELSRLAPHLRRVLDFAAAMAGATTNGAMTALEETATAAMLLDWSGRVAVMNESARAIIGRGLSLAGGRLTADWPGAQPALDALVAASLAVDAGPGFGPVAAPGPDGAVLMVEAVPARRGLTDAFGRTGALILITDPNRRPRPASKVLRSAFGLTAREAEVALGLAAGEGVAEIGEALGLKASSVRQVLKALFWKTGTRRQSQLVAMLARLPDRR